MTEAGPEDPETEMVAAASAPYGEDVEPLGIRTFHGVKWSYLSTIGSFVVQMGYTATISRLIGPGTFGTLALAQVVLRFGTYFSQLGIGPAIVQKRDLERDDIQVAFTVSTLLGAFFTLGFIALAPLTASWLRDPDLADVVAWMAPVFLLSGLGAVANALVRRQLRFRALAAIDFGSYAIAYPLVGVALAWAGAGTASLVAAAITQAALLSGFSWLAARHRLRPKWVRSRVRSLVHFGGWVSVTGFMDFLGGNADTFAVGRFSGTATLGQYNRATLLVGLPAYHVVNNANRVLLPTFSRIQAQEERFRVAYVGGMALLLAFVIPMVAVTIALAAPMVAVLFGPQWRFAATLIPYVAIGATLDRLISFPAILTEARGRVRTMAAIQFVHLIVAVALVALVVARNGGVKELALAWAFGQAVTYAIYLLYMQQQLQPDARHLARAHAECLLLSLAAAAPAVLFDHLGSLPAIAQVLGGGLLGTFAYLAVLALVPGLLARRELNRLGIEAALTNRFGAWVPLRFRSPT